jgi:ankyrin repeat protein
LLVKNHSVNVNKLDKYGDTALMKATWNGGSSAIEALLNAGANLNYVNGFGDTALRWAVIRGHETVVETFLRRDAIIEPAKSEGLLVAAVMYNRERLVDILIARGANLNKADRLVKHTPLMWAAWNGYDAMAQALLGAGAYTGLQDSKGETAEALAREKGHNDLADMIANFRAVKR